MFSDEITTSDAFLDMPTESQNLYFHLGMNADDDGFFSNPKMIQRVLGASDDSLKILFAKKFLISFENGICVVKHWRINNQIRKDRYTPTKYLTEKTSLFIKENGAYTQDENKGLPVPKGHFGTKDIDVIEHGNQLATTRQPSIGKVSIDKIREELPIWLNKNAWSAWEQHRKEKKKSLTPTSKKLQLRFLEENKENHAQIIKNSITNGWTGLFPIKQDGFKKLPPRFVEPNTSKEDNERRNEILRQSESLANKFKA